MKFKYEKLIDREIEIAKYLLQENSIKDISAKTGLSKRHIAAHIRNMITKLKVENEEALKQLLHGLQKKLK
ncbi:MAG TPA: LuxR C-terminal-related transcriptional regulator [Parafilimonas sp.]|nr:LuxR C-terminal-related transcriptional regulator [Parafilimonas sp.]